MLVSITRTVTPFGVAYVLGLPVTPWLLDTLGISTDQAAAAVGGAVAVVVGAIYYVGVRVLERYKSQVWGWALGYARSPRYSPPAS